MTKESGETGKAMAYASPPCMAEDVDPTYFDPDSVDPARERDLAQWRKAMRERFYRERRALDAEARQRIVRALEEHLDTLLAERVGNLAGRVIGGYWPIQDEPDLRSWMTAQHERRAHLALPAVEKRNMPLTFRRWTPSTRMVRGHWNIPEPPETAARMVPEILLAPLLGWDVAGYRLGYGGGYFDRTLAALQKRPLVIGVGLQGARLVTICPQQHDIPMDAIVTEAGLQYPQG